MRDDSDLEWAGKNISSSLPPFFLLVVFFQLSVLAADETLGWENGVAGISHRLALGRLPHDALTRLGEGDNGVIRTHNFSPCDELCHYQAFSSCVGWVHRQFSSRRLVTQLQLLTFSPQSSGLFGYRGTPPCLLVWAWRQDAASEEILAPQGEFEWCETDRSKALANIVLIEADVGHRGLERLWFKLRDRWRTINLYNCSLNLLAICTCSICFQPIKKLLSECYLFLISTCFSCMSALMKLLWRLCLCLSLPVSACLSYSHASMMNKP